ncbi:MAG TPA: tetratricopeptide repeat protein [Thermoanaerobaculia bacterium]|nr:tetratricopeptide repeat protein [Thermoanaerobaculia bacterium]
MRRLSVRLLSGLLVMSLAMPGVASAASLASGVQLFESRRFEEARAFFEAAAAKDPRDPAAAYYAGRSLFALRRYEPAMGWLEKAVELAPKNSEYHLWLGRACGQAALEASVLRAPGLAKRTKAAWEKAVALEGGNLDARQDLMQYYLNAPGIMGGSEVKAREQAAEIQKRDAVRGHVAWAIVHATKKNPAAAEKELAAAIRLDPSNPRPRFALGALQQNAERWAEAFETYEAILEIEPYHWDSLYQIGKIGATTGQRLDRAEECLKRYLGHTPAGYPHAPLSNAHYRLGMVYEKKGNKALARTHYRKAVELDPKLEEARRALGKLG